MLLLARRDRAKPSTTTCERCGAESDGLNLTIVVGTPWYMPSREYACRECYARKRNGRSGELGEPSGGAAGSVELHRCERCGQRMIRWKLWVRSGKTLILDRFCRECAVVAPKELAAKRARLSRQTRRAASGTPTWTCADCEKEIEGRVYWAGWYAGTHRCEACERTAQEERNRRAWDLSVENGTPGQYVGLFDSHEIPNPDDFQPDLDTEACEVCGRETDFMRSMSERREVRWCGHNACYAEAVRLAKRVEPADTRPCERCGEMHSRKRGARYCSDLCRALASRERRASESGPAGRPAMQQARKAKRAGDRAGA